MVVLRGDELEIVMESLMLELGFKYFRNVRFTKNDSYRQIDGCYVYADKCAIVECKISSNGSVGYRLSNGEVSRKGQLLPKLDNIVDKLEDERLFTGADRAILVTNSTFASSVHDEASKYKIMIIEGKDLNARLEGMGCRSDVNTLMESVDLDAFDLRQYPVSGDRLRDALGSFTRYLASRSSLLNRLRVVPQNTT